MKIAITDANIFIDILYLEVEQALFHIDLVIYTTTQVLDELDEHQIIILNALVEAGILVVYAFTEEEADLLSGFVIKKGLSRADHSVIFIAEKLKALVISGDNLVRKVCHSRNLEVHGILWLMDQFIHHQQLTHQQAHDKLTALMLFNKRLPAKECQQRLDTWALL